VPELPEVETIVRALRDGGRGGGSLKGRKISSADILWHKSLANLSQPEFNHQIAGQTIIEISRRGKYICLQLDRDWLFVHLRMSGDLRVEENPALDYLSHDRFALIFSDSSRMIFNDARKFGRVWFDKNTETIFNKLGIEPFDDSLTPQLFSERLHQKRKQIKTLLLDQSFIAGMGNIYTDESLHLAGIHPLRIASSLSGKESKRLLLAIRSTLLEGISRNGASIDWVYRGGEFQNNFRVYQQTGHACPVCGNIIERIVVGQRGTHFCPVCQPERAGR
jgi:formamidopyrimidine-DNA glycosylase